MNNKRIPLAIALAAALCGTPPGATAAALGEIAALSALGDSFRAEIMLPGGTAADAECFRVVSANAGDIPTLRRGRVTISATGAGTRLVVRDTERINEPVLRLALENVCESRLRREYTLLMPFAQAARLPAAPTSASASARAPATPEARSRPAAARAATPARAGANRSPRSLSPCIPTMMRRVRVSPRPPPPPTRSCSPTPPRTPASCLPVPHCACRIYVRGAIRPARPPAPRPPLATPHPAQAPIA
jgi:Tfp pilus assembly protein FimV